MILAIACGLVLSCAQVHAAGRLANGPRQLRVVAVIDGVDELLIKPTEAQWVHRAFGMPERVAINSREWDFSSGLRWSVEEGEPFLAADVDLAGAQVTLVRGRGEIDSRPNDGGLMISFDDSRPGGAGEYEVLVEFADEVCAELRVLGDLQSTLEPRPELLIEARIDGRDELHLGAQRADWLHLAWSWPKDVRIDGRSWDPESAPLGAGDGAPFLPANIDLDDVRMELEQGRGAVQLEVSGERLLLKFDDDADFGADDYRVRLHFPEPMASAQPRLPTGPAVRFEVSHPVAAEVAGAKLTIQAKSPASGEWLPWPGMFGMAFDGRCVLALPAGTYRFEVLHVAGDRMTALRSGPLRLTSAQNLSLPASDAHTIDWRDDDAQLELRELAIAAMDGGAGVSWSRSADSEDLELVASPLHEFDLRAVGVRGEVHSIWWTRQRFGERAQLDSSAQDWIRCEFEGEASASFEVSLHGPRSQYDLPVADATRVHTNRRFLGFSYSCEYEDGKRIAFHQRQVLLPQLGGRHTFNLGGALSARGSAAILYNENLGSADARQLWWQLDLVDSAGSVLDAQASSVEWQPTARMRDGTTVPSAPLSDAGLEQLGDPIESVVLGGSYRLDGLHEVQVDPLHHVVFENHWYRSLIPGHLDGRARAYLDKARLAYQGIEEVRGHPGSHTEPIELKWWMNGGAVGVWGSITMPIAGMAEDFDWFSFPWALAHESLHGFGYPHGPELDRIDRAVIARFNRLAWQAEFDAEFVPKGW